MSIHLPELTLPQMLRERARTALAELEQAFRPILAHAGEQGGDGVGRGAFDRRFEEQVDGGALVPDHRSGGDASHVAGAHALDEQVEIARGDEGEAGASGELGERVAALERRLEALGRALAE